MSYLISLWTYLSGKKTYYLGVATCFYALFGYWKGLLTSEQALQIASPALMLMGIRHGMSPVGVVPPTVQ